VRVGRLTAIVAAAVLTGAACLGAQDPTPKPDAAPSQKPAEAGAKPATAADGGSGAQGSSGPEIYDPYHAAKSVEVGKFYLHKGDLDAAIERFKDAIHYKYDYAIPRILLAEIYEKKHEDGEAVLYYKEYLKIMPNGPDAKKAKERIEKLSQRAEK